MMYNNMVAKLSLFSRHNQHEHSNQKDSWMWSNPSQHAQEDHQDDDSWEVRAFAQDTSNVLGATWPPRSYTCTFCRREFRSAQALGGHMNVHRRDRARLHHHQSTRLSSSSSTRIIPAHELSTNNDNINGGFGLLYHQLPHHPPTTTTSDNINNASGAIFTPTKINDSTSKLVSSSNSTRVFACAHQSGTATNASLQLQQQLQSQVIDCSYRQTMVVGSSSSYGDGNSNGNNRCDGSETEEIDLELRL